MLFIKNLFLTTWKIGINSKSFVYMSFVLTCCVRFNPFMTISIFRKKTQLTNLLTKQTSFKESHLKFKRKSIYSKKYTIVFPCFIALSVTRRCLVQTGVIRPLQRLLILLLTLSSPLSASSSSQRLHDDLFVACLVGLDMVLVFRRRRGRSFRFRCLFVVVSGSRRFFATLSWRRLFGRSLFASVEFRRFRRRRWQWSDVCVHVDVAFDYWLD